MCRQHNRSVIILLGGLILGLIEEIYCILIDMSLRKLVLSNCFSDRSTVVILTDYFISIVIHVQCS